ncbi:MAG: hypothetical protein JHC88_01140 [Niveispirillum sp.]|nr:hypothetical protein [Niveispirillum sp.]
MTPLPPDPWSIAIYQGPDPLHLSPLAGGDGPVMTREQVTDVRARFVADPFLFPHGGLWHLFFEVLNHDSGLGEVGWASSTDLTRWTYQRIVLREGFHLSYPQVFAHDGQIYMLPETLAAGAVRLYRAEPFPTRWVPVADLVTGRLADPSLFQHDGRWWMFACPTPDRHDALVLYHADDLFGPWHPHPANPLRHSSPSGSRPGGPVVAWKGGLYRLAQDCGPRYGHGLRAFAITVLTPTRYQEVECPESPILAASGQGWNGKGMHHADIWPWAGGVIAAVDGLWREPSQ